MEGTGGVEKDRDPPMARMRSLLDKDDHSTANAMLIARVYKQELAKQEGLQTVCISGVTDLEADDEHW